MEEDVSKYFASAAWDELLNTQRTKWNDNNFAEYDDNIPYEELFSVTLFDNTVFYYMTKSGYTDTYLYGRIALISSYESGGFFNSRKFQQVCSELGSNIIPVPSKEVEDKMMVVKKAFTLG